MAKFTQNEELAKFLKNTGDKDIGKANKFDQFWGTGVSLWDNEAGKKGTWKGDNHLGKLLMDVRSSL